jgi:uncharacterized membrane protein
MLSPTVDTVRLFLHVLAASVWVGGQIALAGIVPSVRRSAPDATKVIARAFARVAWPANTSTAYRVTLFLKILLAMVSGGAAAVHQVGRSKAALAIGGALGLLGALGAMFCGYLLTTGS